MKNIPWSRNTIGRSTCYSFYVKNRKEKHKVDLITYRAIMDEFNQEVIRLIIEDGFQWDIPNRFGMLYIVGKRNYQDIEYAAHKKNKLNVNWQLTNKYWAENKEARDKKIFILYENYHTDGYIYKIAWDRIYGSRQVRMLDLKTAGTFKRKAGAYIKEDRHLHYQRY